ncbi:MAG TPA: hypothetical protein VIX19_11730, partial [Terriglobales bacterium]
VPGNLFWVLLDDSCASKTDRGVLETRRIAPKRYSHIWHDREPDAQDEREGLYSHIVAGLISPQGPCA